MLGYSYICLFIDFNVNLMNHHFFLLFPFYSSTDPLVVLPHNFTDVLQGSLRS